MKKYIFLLCVLLLGAMYPVYADSPPQITETQAINIAQDFLDSQGLSYKASSTTLKTKVRVIATGETRWEDYGVFKNDSPDFGGPGNFEFVVTAWAVQVVDNSGNDVGIIYVNAEAGEIIETTISGVTVPLESTGVPVTGIILAVLMVSAGLIISKK
jgi:hypothetical protein